MRKLRTKMAHKPIVLIVGLAVVLAVSGLGVKLLMSSDAAAPAGMTVPDTTYPIPANAVYMATTGNDAGSGSRDAPVKSLARAIAVTPAGGTLVIRGGLYRDGSATAKIFKTMTIQAYPHEQVWFDGMDVTSGWTNFSANQWQLTWSTPDFCNNRYYELPFRQQTANGPCTYYDQYGDTSNPMSPDPQMVYVDGVYIHEVATAAEAVGNNFYYDQANRKIVLGINPAGRTVEVTKRPTAIWVEGGPGSVTIRGIGFAHYASDNFADAAGHGALILNSPNTTIENNVFAENAGAAIQMPDPRNGVIRGNNFYKNGGNGLDANGHQKSAGIVDNILVENNIFDGNNTERFGVGCNYSCEAAGSKMAHMMGVTVRDNIFKNGVGEAHGWWCDMACTNAKIVRNVFQNNGGAGIFYEISDTGIIASNLSIGNGKYGIKNGSSNTKIYNNTLVNNKVGALIYDDDRSVNYNWGTDAGPDTVNVDMKNNIFSGGTNSVVQSWRTNSAYAKNTGPNTFYSGYDYNSYFRNGTTPRLVEWRDGTQQLYNTLAEMRAGKGKETNGHDITTGTDPFFVNQAAGDYHVRSSSVAYNSGASLPDDVAAAIGVAASPVSRGALKWIGSGAAPQTGDTTAPSVSLGAPANNATVSGIVSLTASASDNIGVSAVTFRVNGFDIYDDTAAPYAASWDSKLVANGNYTLSAIARDAAGNTKTSSINVSVNNSAADTSQPVLTMTTPTVGQKVSGVVDLAATASDNVGVVSVTFQVNGFVIYEDTTPPYVASWDSKLVGDGTYTLSAVARDAAGNTKTVAVSVTSNNSSATMPGDCNKDGRVNAIDLSILLSHDGQNYIAADFNKDGTVGAADLAILLSKWTW